MDMITDIIQILGANISVYDEEKCEEIMRNDYQKAIDDLKHSKNDAKLQELENELEEKVNKTKEALQGKIEQLKDSLKKFSHLKFLGDFINLTHKYHKNYLMKTRKCRQFHCIECLQDKLDEKECPHGIIISPYELVKIPELVALLPHVDDHSYVNHKCNNCRNTFKASDLENRECLCTVCNFCLIKRYKEREIKCKVCGILVQSSTMKLLDPKIEIYSECISCNLVINEAALKGGKCYLCIEAQ
ncbi:hypothetical protein SteCoe_7074 [Stentor coeruleus]|uniref:Uncharacterized protein n=1 Tax=Stentor coeruleus TaxID=5963 RepID=A0A1R2CNH9_9CILI|nr:hypothetical protein SteCoe_12429 [Stentor coeruleus]OMJ90577.1 hypothetical protein SteCoe_7074 [Stentor coeruleus]